MGHSARALGEGANFNSVDYGRARSPKNPCGDPAVWLRYRAHAASAPRAAPSQPGPCGPPVTRWDSTEASFASTRTGRWPAVEPARGTDRCQRPPDHRPRLPEPVPIRLAAGYVGAVGRRRRWNDWEEIDRIPNTTDAVLENFGWPCCRARPGGREFGSADLAICENLYSTPGAVTSPFSDCHHTANVVSQGDVVPDGGSSVTGQAFQFYSGGPPRRSTTARSSPTSQGAPGSSAHTSSTRCWDRDIRWSSWTISRAVTPRGWLRRPSWSSSLDPRKPGPFDPPRRSRRARAAVFHLARAVERHGFGYRAGTGLRCERAAER